MFPCPNCDSDTIIKGNTYQCKGCGLCGVWIDMFLAEATNFDGIKIREKPEWLEHPAECPVCKGYGMWNLTIDAYGKGRHFQQGCFQCNGHGWVEEEDRMCIHEWTELTPKEAGARGVKHWGMCWHVYECIKCKQTRSVDSSD